MSKATITAILYISLICIANAYWAHDTELELAIKKSEPLKPAPKTLSIGNRTVRAQLLNTDGVQFFGSNTMRTLQAIFEIDGKLVVVDNEGVLYGFVIPEGDSPKLKIDSSFGIKGRIDMRTTSPLRIKRFGKNKIIIKATRGVFFISDGKLIKVKTRSFPLISDSTGSWGVDLGSKSYLYERNPESNNYDRSIWFDQRDSETYPEGYKLVDAPSSVAAISGNTIALAGSFKKENKKYSGVTCIDRKNHKVLFNVASPDSESGSFFSTVSDIEFTPSGLSVLDANMRNLILISNTGEVLSKIDLKELFDLRYPWINDSSPDSSGRLYVIATNELKGDGKVSQGFIYRISGL